MIKRTILFIVEGENDRKELFAILKTPYFDNLREQYRIEFDVTHGDITTKNGSTEKNIVDVVGKRIALWIRNHIGYSYHNIAKVVHVVDTDGAFIPDAYVYEGEVYDYQYEWNGIKALDQKGCIRRNRNKSAELVRLYNTKEVRNIPYVLLYVSCNMDHVLFNNRNLSDEKKGACANYFVKDCNANPEIIFDKLYADKVKSVGSYLDSWEWIQKECHSLYKHSNLNIFFSEFIDK